MKDQLALQDNKKLAIKFSITLVVLYLIFSQGNLFMNSVMSPEGKYYNQFFEENLNYIQGLRSAIIHSSVTINKLLGFYSINSDTEVLILNGPSLNINYSCLGLGILSFMVAFIIAFPANVKSKFKITIIGVLLIFVLNVLRITGLGIFMSTFQSQRKYFIYHHEIFNLFIYIVVMLLLYKWIKSSSNPIINSTNEPTNQA